MSVAVVLPGGGARGGYEVGALSVLLPALESRGEQVSIWCGTSVGAINAACYASLAGLSAWEQCQGMLERWQELRMRDVVAPKLLVAGSKRRATVFTGGHQAAS